MLHKYLRVLIPLKKCYKQPKMRSAEGLHVPLACAVTASEELQEWDQI